MTKPTSLPEWASTDATLPDAGVPNKAQPTVNLRTVGFDLLNLPLAEEENWWRNNVYEWTQYLDAEVVPQTSATGAIIVPSGTTAQRPTDNVARIRYNTTIQDYESYNVGTGWDILGNTLDLTNLEVAIQPDTDGNRDVGTSSKGFGAVYTDSLVGRSSGVETDINNLKSQIASTWVNFNGSGIVAIRDSHNVSFITDNGLGNYTANLTTALANTDYAEIITTYEATDATLSSSYRTISRTVGALQFGVLNTVNGTGSWGFRDHSIVNVVIFGGL